MELFGFSVHWYGIMYLLAFMTAAILLPHIQKYRKLHLTRDEWLTVLCYGIAGVIAGGRIGYVLLYEPAYFAQYPAKIFAVWEGGMASHGGFIGVAGALTIASFIMHIPAARLADIVTVPAAIGLALGRLGNFINQELYGTVTTLPWAISIPGVEGLRHPLQLYDMTGSLIIAAACLWHLKKTRDKGPGRTIAFFLILYGLMRFFLEYIREQQYPLVDLGILLSRGQLYTLPLLLLGMFLWVGLWNHERAMQAE